VPTSVTIFGGERVPFPKPPRELAERYYNVTDWSEHPFGGHSPAVAESESLASVIREFFRPLARRSQGSAERSGPGQLSAWTGISVHASARSDVVPMSGRSQAPSAPGSCGRLTDRSGMLNKQRDSRCKDYRRIFAERRDRKNCLVGRNCEMPLQLRSDNHNDVSMWTKTATDGEIRAVPCDASGCNAIRSP
jgi:hypothetical protein